MIAFSSFMYPHTISVSTSPDSVGARGGVSLTDTTSATFPAYVEAQGGIQRTEAPGAPIGVTRYDIFTPVDPGADTDTVITWGSRKFTALARSHDLSGAGVNWLTKCQEVV